MTPNEESDWYPRYVKVAANTIGYAAELEGVTLDRQQVLAIAVRLDSQDLLAKEVPHDAALPVSPARLPS